MALIQMWNPHCHSNGIKVRHRAVCQRGRWASKGGGLRDPTSVGEGNEAFFIRAFFIRVSKSLPNRHVLKTLKESLKEKT